MADSRTELNEYIKKRILIEGYPLELESTEILESKNWHTSNQAPFIDPDDKVLRSIDIEAYHKSFDGGIYKEWYPLCLLPRIGIECKKSDSHAWVFFEKNEAPHIYESFLSLRQLFDPFWRNFDETGGFYTRTEKACLGGHYSNASSFAISYCQIDIRKMDNKPSEKSRNDIFRGVMQLIKYCEYSFGKETNLVLVAGGYVPSVVFYPVIVFDGQLYGATLSKEGVSLEQKDHIVLNANYLTTNPRDSRNSNAYLIDVVSKRYFPRLCDLVLHDIESFRTEYSKNREAHVRDVQKVLSRKRSS